MKKGFLGGIFLGVVLFVAFILTLACAVRVPVGYEAIVYSMNGGVQNETLTQGWHVVSPMKQVKEFTIGNEQLILSKDNRKGSEKDESFKVSTSDDASIAISFQMSYRFNPETLTDTYKKFKGMNGNDIVNNRVKAVLKSKVSEVTTDYSMMDIYSGNRSEINNKLTEYLNNAFAEEYGIEVLDASIIDVHPDKKLKTAIDSRVTALQKKQQAKAEQETVKVEAETKLIKAQNEAAIKIAKAKAEAEANKLLSESVTQELIDMKTAEARLKHGWITVKGSGTIVTDTTK
ncbi:MAG: prohibitin family protein [Lachnospiraceae bacterium]|nr:prohibitin family protein [Lachnospiraceae bacterium]